MGVGFNVEGVITWMRDGSWGYGYGHGMFEVLQIEWLGIWVGRSG